MTGNLELLQIKGRADENLWARREEAEALSALAEIIQQAAPAPAP